MHIPRDMALLDITEVVRRTGLSARALRFYAARGLVRPLRTAAGRRIFGAAELERLGRIVALKAAGFTLSQIGAVLADRPLPIAGIVAAQLAALDRRIDDLAAARAVLIAARSRLDRGAPLDAATLCSLISQGDRIMTHADWKQVVDRYYTPEEQARWADRMPTGFDQQGYADQWEALGTRIAATLPLDPASPQAGELYDAWQALLAPFTAVATPEMMKGATKLYDAMPEWQGERQPPFSPEVWSFIKAVKAARG